MYKKNYNGGPYKILCCVVYMVLLEFLENGVCTVCKEHYLK